MRKYIRNIFFVTIIFGIIIGASPFPAVHAWGDNGGGRESYTVEEINNGAIGDTDPNSENYPGTIVFNSISDSVIGNEKNFVGARVCEVQANGRCNAAELTTKWDDEIKVEDGQTYIIRMYVHNNNPNGMDAVAEDTRVAFSIPSDSAKEIQVNGFITSSNATPSKYWDYVNFTSDMPFHLDYVYGSALLENNKIGLGGLQLSDDVVQAASGGTLIGYDALDGRVPGCYQYAEYVSIQVRVVFDYDYTVEKKVRLAGDKEWKDVVTANVGDKVEFQIRYTNTSKQDQLDVAMRDILPQSLRYVPGSTKIKNSNYPNGATINGDALVSDNGLKIGDAAAGGGTVVMFTAEVIGDNLGCGSNALVNWGQASVGAKIIQDHATVVVQKYPQFFVPIIIFLSAAIIGCLAIIAHSIYKIIKHNRRR